LVQVELPPSDLSAGGMLSKSLQLLQDILSSQDSSSVTPEERKQSVAQVNTGISKVRTGTRSSEN